MKHPRLLSLVFRLAAVGVFALGLLPVGKLLNPLRKIGRPDDPYDPTYFLPDLLNTGMIALVGFVAGYLLFRAGSHFKSKGKPVGSQPPAIKQE